MLVCELPDTGRIRVSSPVASINQKEGLIITESGRVYELFDSEAEETLDLELALMRSGLGESYQI